VSRDNTVKYEIPRKGASAEPFRVQGKEIFSSMDADECPLVTFAEYLDETVTPAEWREMRSSTVAEANMNAGARYVDLTFDQEYFLNNVQPMRGNSYAMDEEITITVRFVTHDPAFEEATIEDKFDLVLKGSGEPLSVYCDYSLLVLATSQSDITYDIPDPSPKPGMRVELDFITALTADNANVSEMCMGLLTTSLDFALPNNGVWTAWKEGTEYTDDANSGFWIYDAVDASGAMVKKIKLAITQEDFIKQGQTAYGTMAQQIPIPASYSWRNEKGRVVF
jgi:hypothetical protein